MRNQEVSPPAVNEKPKIFYGYVIALAVFLTMMVAHGIFMTFGIFFKPLLTEFGWSRATLSGAQSLCSILTGFLAIIAGGLNDRFGPRIVMATCGFFIGLGYLLLSQVNSVWQLYLFYSLILAIGLSPTDVLLLSTVARWFVKKRGMVSGIVKAGTGLGMLIIPLVASGLISVYGWRTSYVILGVIALVFIIPIAQLLRRDPGQMGQLPDGEGKANADSLGLAERGLSIREAIRTRQFWMICAVHWAIFFCMQTIFVHIAPHAEDCGLSGTNAAGVISIIGGASIVGRLVMGSAGDRVGNKQAMIICFLLLIAALSWLLLAKGLWMLYLFAAIYGLSHGGFFALYSPMVAELFGTRSHGAIFGIAVFSGCVGGAIGPLLAGYIFDITQSYQIAFFILLALSIIGLILIVSLRPIGEGGICGQRKGA